MSTAAFASGGFDPSSFARVAATGVRLPGCEALMAIGAVGISNDHESRK